MGFRNPATTAEGVDTSAGGPAGVRMYQDESGAYPAGVLEFFSPFGSAFLRATPLTDGTFSNGSRTTLAGVTGAPVLHLDQRESPQGGYESVASITGADRVELPSQRITFPGGGGINAAVGQRPPFAYLDPGGFVHCGGLLVDTAGGNSRVLGTLPEGFRPLNGLAPLAMPGYFAGAYNLWPVNVQTDGVIYVPATAPAGITYFLDHLVFARSN